MRYILIAFFILSCNTSTSPEEPVDPPELPNNESVIIKGVAGSTSTVDGDTLRSYIINPIVVEEGNNIPPVTSEEYGLSIIIPQSLFEQWKQYHSLFVYAVLEPKEYQPDSYYWYLIEVKSLGYRP